MCEFCENPDCHLTKAAAVAHGSILEDNARGIMREATDDTPMTYSFKDVPAYNSLSAIFPDSDDENPHAYTRFIFDEDDLSNEYWECWSVQNPLSFQTEAEFLKKLEGKTA